MPLFEKYYTVEEANALLPELRRLHVLILEDLERMDLLSDGAPRPLETIPTNGGGKAIDGFFATGREAQGYLKEILARGVQIKDVRAGLFDFPAWRDGEEVLLCWRVDEPEVAFWHDLQHGFASRRPVTD